MADEIIARDQNYVTVLAGISDDSAQEIRMFRVDPDTGRLKVSITGGGTGTVTQLDGGTGILLTPDPITTTGSIALATELQPIATLTGNAGKFLRVNAGETAVEYATVSVGLVVGTTTITGGTATKILYNNAGVLGEYTISGSGNVAMTTSPSFTTPILGTPTSGNLVNCTGYTIANVAGLGANVATWLATPSSANLAAAMTDKTGTGVLVFGTSPTFTTSIITPKIIGGTGTTGTQLTIQTTSGNGTTDQMVFVGGNNGATTFATLKANSLDLGTSAVLGTGTIELGAASDTTLARSAAGQISVEGVQVVTISNTVTMTNKILSHTVEPATDDTYTGEEITGFNATATIAQWEAVYLSTTGWALTDADAAATAGGVMVCLAAAAGTNGNPLTVVKRGVIRNDGWNWSTVGAPLYLSTTAGAITDSAPSGTDDVIRIVGYVLSDDCIWFEASNDWITHT